MNGGRRSGAADRPRVDRKIGRAETAKNDRLDFRMVDQRRANGTDRDAGRQFDLVAVDSRTDARKRQRARALGAGQRDRTAIARGQQLWLALLAAMPYLAYGVDDVLGWQAIAACELGIAGFTASQQAACMD